MENEKETLFDLVFDTRRELLTISVKEENDETFLKRDNLDKLISSRVKNKKDVKVLKLAVEEYEEALNDEMEFWNKTFYKYGIADIINLKQEVTMLDRYEFKRKSERESEGLLEKWYELRVNDVARLSEKEIKIIEEDSNVINVYDIFPNISEEEKAKFDDLVEKIIENESLKCGYTCEKYYKQGFKDGMSLALSK